MWRDAVARDLTEAGYAVVATAADGAQALRVAAAARPDVVVLDLRLPDMSGVEVTRGLQAASPPRLVCRQRRAAGRARRGEGGRGRLPAEVGDAPGVARRGAPHRRRRGVFTPGSPRSCSASSAGCRPPRPGQAGACRGCQNARPRSSAWSPPACPTSRSPPGSSCPTAPCRTTCRTRWASCNCTTGSSWSGTRSSTVLRASSRRASLALRGQLRVPDPGSADPDFCLGVRPQAEGGRDGADLGGRPEQARLRHRV